jgi:hypothetical protein
MSGGKEWLLTAVKCVKVYCHKRRRVGSHTGWSGTNTDDEGGAAGQSEGSLRVRGVWTGLAETWRVLNLNSEACDFY